MSYVSNICIAKEAGGKIEQINSIEVIANKGILKDRYFKKDSEKEMNQITLIESENVDYYNQLTGANLLPTDFRRNIITRGISLNKLVGEKILVGKVMMKVHDLLTKFCDSTHFQLTKYIAFDKESDFHMKSNNSGARVLRGIQERRLCI